MPDLAGAFAYRHFEAYLPPDNPTFHNPSFDGAPYRVLIARLSPFRDVDRSIPHLYLYHEVRRALPAAYIDLAFFPGEHERAAFERQGHVVVSGAISSWTLHPCDSTKARIDPSQFGHPCYLLGPSPSSHTRLSVSCVHSRQKIGALPGNG